MLNFVLHNCKCSAINQVVLGSQFREIDDNYMKLWRKPFDQAEKAITPPMVIVNADRCKGCGYCVAFCPREVLAMGTKMNAKGYLLPKAVDESKCVGCCLCEVICPDFSIEVTWMGREA